jgi:hypothetical protein
VRLTAKPLFAFYFGAVINLTYHIGSSRRISIRTNFHPSSDQSQQSSIITLIQSKNSEGLQFDHCAPSSSLTSQGTPLRHHSDWRLSAFVQHGVRIDHHHIRI